MPTESPSARQRLITAMAQALPRRGYHGVGLRELLDSAQTPKGVMYHHFPGGKSELAVAAIDASVAAMQARTAAARARHGAPLQVLRAWFSAAQAGLAGSDYESGCPFATVALESGTPDRALRDALARAFSALRSMLSDLLIDAGIARARADALAVLIVSAYEGALIQARVAENTAAMQAAGDALLDIVSQAISSEASTP